MVTESAEVSHGVDVSAVEKNQRHRCKKTFFTFLTFLSSNRFLFFKNVGKVQTMNST